MGTLLSRLACPPQSRAARGSVGVAIVEHEPVRGSSLRPRYFRRSSITAAVFSAPTPYLSVARHCQPRPSRHCSSRSAS